MKLNPMANLVRRYRKANLAWYMNQASLYKMQQADSLQRCCYRAIQKAYEMNSRYGERLSAMFEAAHRATIWVEPKR